ncbi:MAG TPA: hypothetical protein VE077_22100 [Candidatus Methylomirabilis sp.]|nr:hypothetical protein [Candidatus Methylomirabilis sp.]
MLWILCATGIGLASQRVPPPVQPGNRETRAGYLVKAEMRNGAIITFPAAANQSMDVPSNGPVARNKGKTLLVLHFELQLKHCARLEREVMVVRENLATESQEGNGLEGKTYRYGGWWVEDAKYALCGPPVLARPIVGPWMNTFWDPITISPEMGQLQLVYEIDPAARNLVFTDGNVTLDVDALLKRH